MNDRLKEALRVALSGALTGGVVGAGGKMLAGARGLGAIGKSGAIGAGLGSLLAGGSNLVGSAVMGEPGPDEGSPSAMRGLVGGALGGALVGGGLGGLGAAGKLAVSGKAPAILRKLAAFAKEELPLDNMLTDKIRQYAMEGGPGAIKKGALLGAGSLGILGAMEGADEGSGYDTIMREMDEKKKEEMRRQMMEQYYAGY